MITMFVSVDKAPWGEILGYLAIVSIMIGICFVVKHFFDENARYGREHSIPDAEEVNYHYDPT